MPCHGTNGTGQQGLGSALAGFVLVRFLGLCPFMGVSGKLEGAIGMSVGDGLESGLGDYLEADAGPEGRLMTVDYDVAVDAYYGLSSIPGFRQTANELFAGVLERRSRLGDEVGSGGGAHAPGDHAEVVDDHAVVQAGAADEQRPLLLEGPEPLGPPPQPPGERRVGDPVDPHVHDCRPLADVAGDFLADIVQRIAVAVPVRAGGVGPHLAAQRSAGP